MAGADPAGGGELPGLRPAHSSARTIAALALIKAAAAQVNAELGVARPRTSPRRSPRAADEVAAGDVGRAVPDRRLPDRLRHLVEHEHQRGDRHAGHRAARARRCTPTTTSTPRSRPTTSSRRSIHVAATEAVVHDLIPALEHLGGGAASARPREFADVVKSGRTHLMDATPVTLGQEFGGYAAQVALRRRAAAGRRCPGSPSCRSAAPRSAPASTPRPASPPRSSPSWPRAPGLPLTEARDHFEAQGARDGAGRDVGPAADASPSA